MDEQVPQEPVMPVQPAQKHNHLFLGIILVIILAVLYLLYSHFFLKFKTVATLSYDSQKAAELLREPDTFAYTRGDKLLIGNPSGQELLLGATDTTKNIQSLTVSKNRRYIAWQQESALYALQVSEKKVLLVYQEVPKQTFDLSPRKNNILFLTKNHLLEVSLENGYIEHRITLPPTQKNLNFNNALYAPSGYAAQVGLFTPEIADRRKIVVNLKNNDTIAVLNDFYKTCTKEPTWKDDHTFYVSKVGQLITYDIINNLSTSLVEEKNSGGIGAYSVSPTDGSIAYTVAREKITVGASKIELNTNAEINLVDQRNNLSAGGGKTLIKTYDPRLGYKQIGIGITNVGWLSDDTLWFTVNTGFSVRDVWVIGKDGSGLKKVFEQVEQYSI